MDVDINNDAHVDGMKKNTSTDSDLEQLKSSMPTIYPNDYDFNAIPGFGFHSTTSRSFVRPSKAIGLEHRNISVPNSLKVCSRISFQHIYYFFFFIFECCGMHKRNA